MASFCRRKGYLRQCNFCLKTKKHLNSVKWSQSHALSILFLIILMLSPFIGNTTVSIKTSPAEPKSYNNDLTSAYTCDTTYDAITDLRAPPVKPTPYAGFDPKIPQTFPISLNDLGNHVACCHSDSNACFAEQFKVISTKKEQSRYRKTTLL